MAATLAKHLPRSKYVAWQLGSWASQLLYLQTSESAAARDESLAILQKAAQALHLPATLPLTTQHVLALGQQLRDLESGSSRNGTLLGLLSFANLLWAVAILGVCITIGPAVWVLFEPVIRRISGLLLQLWPVMQRYVVYTAKLLLPVYAWAAYYGCLVMLASLPRWASSRLLTVAAGAPDVWMFMHAYCSCMVTSASTISALSTHVRCN